MTALLDLLLKTVTGLTNVFLLPYPWVHSRSPKMLSIALVYVYMFVYMCNYEFNLSHVRVGAHWMTRCILTCHHLFFSHRKPCGVSGEAAASEQSDQSQHCRAAHSLSPQPLQAGRGQLESALSEGRGGGRAKLGWN